MCGLHGDFGQHLNGGICCSIKGFPSPTTILVHWGLEFGDAKEPRAKITDTPDLA